MRKVYEFDWDEGNINKNWDKHRVSPKECEEVFANEPLFLLQDIKHSKAEERWVAYGKTNTGRKLQVAFTERSGKIRVISVRDQNRKERRFYENKTN